MTHRLFDNQASPYAWILGSTLGNVNGRTALTSGTLCGGRR